jgi:DNA-binding protein HU-beta
MTYSELIDRLSEELNLTKTESKHLLDEIIAELTSQLGQGTSFTIPDLGTFKTKIKEVQKIYNPHYEKFMLIPPKRVVEFSPGKNLKDNLKYINPE